MSPQEAAELVGVSVGRALAGGEVGAFEATWNGGRGVLKRFVTPQDRDDVLRALPLVDRLRERGYPAPRTLLRGESAEGLVTVQEWAPGAFEDLVDHALVHQVLSLNEIQVQAGVMHGDLHHRNILVDPGRRITAVVDWDGAREGDPVFDLVTLAFCSVVAEREAGAAERLWACARERRPGHVVDGYVRRLARRQIEWSLRHRGGRDVELWRRAAEDQLSGSV